MSDYEKAHNHIYDISIDEFGDMYCENDYVPIWDKDEDLQVEGEEIFNGMAYE